MAGSIDHNAHVLAARMNRRAQQIEAATNADLTSLAQMVARAMRERVPKFRSELVNSIDVRDDGPTQKTVLVGSEHGWYVEEGVKPGGKGLPRFFDPAAADAVAWLQTKLRGGARAARRGSPAFQRAELSLRDAYEGWAHHIRARGVPAQPFVEPTARALAQPIAQALRRTVVAAATQDAGGAGA